MPERSPTPKVKKILFFCNSLRMFYPVYPTMIPIDTNNYESMELESIPDIVLHTSVLPSGVKVSVVRIYG